MNVVHDNTTPMLTPEVVNKLDAQQALEIVATLGDSFITTLR